VVARPEVRWLGRVVFAGEQALGERLIDQHAGAVLGGEGKDVAVPRRWRRGQGVEPDGQVAGAEAGEQVAEPCVFVFPLLPGDGEPVGDETVRPAHAHRLDQALLLEGAHLLDCPVQVLIIVPEAGIVQEIDIQVVGAEVFQGGFQLAAHRAGQVGVGGGSGEVADLGGDHQAVAGHLRYQVAQEPLGAAVPVDVGSVEQVRAKLICGFQAA